MEEQIARIYNFIKENRQYSLPIQRKYREECLKPYLGDTSRMIYSLLHQTYYTQAVPNLNSGQVFFEKLVKNEIKLGSLEVFCDSLASYVPQKPYLSLFDALNNEPGWGEKTSSLFVKQVYQIHMDSGNSSFHFWEDVPILSQDDIHFLPVDAVIIDFFSRFDSSLNNFKKINNHLRNYKNKDIWDDLWFWGFITQEGSKSPRKLGFNKGKYWLLIHTDKDPEMIKKIESKCKEFISLLPKS